MDIAEVIHQTGLPASSLRYYEEKGLIASTGRHGLRRQYHDSVIERLGYIALARKAGFTLAEIAELLIEKNAGKKQYCDAICSSIKRKNSTSRSANSAPCAKVCATQRTALRLTILNAKNSCA